MTELNSLAILTLLKQTGLRITNDLKGSLLIKPLTGSVLIQQRTVLSIQILLAWRDLQTGEKIIGLLQLTIHTDLQTVLVLTGLLIELT